MKINLTKLQIEVIQEMIYYFIDSSKDIEVIDFLKNLNKILQNTFNE